MSFLSKTIDSVFTAKRTGTFECPCGAVKCNIELPASSYKLIDQTTALCQCDDCLGFCQACPNGDYVVDNYSTHLVNFYRTDVTVTKGREYIGGVKLNEKTPMVRLFCKECGTPLGAEITMGPVLLLYSKLITKGPIYLPKLVLGSKWAPPEARAYAGDAIVKYYNFGFIFMLKVMGRVFLGFLLGKGAGPTMLDNNDGYQSVPVGFETVKDSVVSKKKAN
jgi:hypothetical protein